MCSALSNLLLTLSLIVVAGLRPIAARAGSSALGRDDSDTLAEMSAIRPRW